VTASVVAGGLVGLGLFLLALGLGRRKPPLSAVLAQFDAGTSERGAAGGVWSAGDLPGWRARLGRSVLAGLRSAGIELSSLREDLRVTDRSVESLCASKALAVAGAGLAPAAVAAVLALVGISVGVLLPVWLSVTLAAAGVIVPDIRVRAEAARRRRSFRHAVGAYLTQVAISLAGGAGPEEALHKALGVSRGWALARLSAALDRARLAGQAPWVALGQLGWELGISELGELAASMSLAGTEGARVRDSLTAKAAALRRHELAEAEAAAAAATERMVLPIALLALGFVIFLLYPALIEVLDAL
jgi:tight adherence protein C